MARNEEAPRLSQVAQQGLVVQTLAVQTPTNSKIKVREGGRGAHVPIRPARIVSQIVGPRDCGARVPIHFNCVRATDKDYLGRRMSPDHTTACAGLQVIEAVVCE